MQKKSVKKEEKERKGEKPKRSWIGLLGGLLAIAGFVLILVTLGCGPDWLVYFLFPLGFICLVLSFILCIIAIVTRNWTPWIIVGILFIILSFFLYHEMTYHFVIMCGDVECTQVKLTLVKANSLDNTVQVKRQAGGGDVNVTSVKITYIPFGTNKEKAATIINPPEGKQSVNELETVTYKIAEDIKAGDTVNIAAIVLNSKGTNTVCNIASSKKAVE